MRKEDWVVDSVRHFAFCSFGNVVAECMPVSFFVGDEGALSIEPFDGFGIPHVKEGAQWSVEAWVEKLDLCGGFLLGKDFINNTDDNLSDMVEEVGEVDVVQLGLDVGKFGKVTASCRKDILVSLRLGF